MDLLRYICSITFLGGLTLGAQPNLKVDTLWSMIPQTHQYLHLKIPVGELFVNSSQVCGLSLTQLSAPNSEAELQMQEEVDGNSNQHRYLELGTRELTPKGTESASSNLRVAGDFSSLNAYGSPEAFRSEIALDPNLSTDLFLDLGVGATRLDLSSLSLRTLSVKSAFSDVMLTYDQPNQINMEKLFIHATRGDVILKQPELAKARHIVVKNDMGHTKLIIGDKHLPHSTISVHAGTGGCTLIIDQDQPTRIIVKAGIFADEEFGSGFTKIGDHVYANQSYTEHCQAGDRGCAHSTTVICNLDLGTLAVMEKR